MIEEEIKILMIDDNLIDAGIVNRCLKRAGILCKFVIVDSELQFSKALADFRPEVILSDYALPKFNSISAFQIARKKIPGVPFILVTGAVSEEFAVECLKSGVDDYILKSNLTRLPSAIRNVINNQKLRKEKNLIESLHNELKEAYLEITDSLNYAKRIQNSILPTDNFIHKFLSDNFVMYKPKSIIAGDFYWFDVKDDMVMIAAADCTGHGVPGALGSIVCSNALQRSVNEFNLTDPGSILDKTRELVQETYALSVIKDGMDISLACLNTKTKELTWSGANNPLLYIKDHVMTDVKGHKQSIGRIENPQPFPTHSVKLNEGDVFYLITDGYSDQFGGDFGKKFKKRKLKEVLMNNYYLPMFEQKIELENIFDDWKGKLDQVDDVTVIGVRV